MSTDLLREAAALMRERAEAAKSSPWRHDDHLQRVWQGTCAAEPCLGAGRCGGTVLTTEYVAPEDAEHIASWHPAVALAAAAALEAEADRCTPQADVIMFDHGWPSPQPAMIAVARAYLGRDA